MTACILNGGPRKNGVVADILTRIKSRLKDDTNVLYFNVYDESIAPCIGCLACRPDGKCVLPEDDAHRIAEAIQLSDILIVGTPTYWGNMTGPLKNLFDRCVPVFEYIDGFKIRKVQKGKRAIIVTASSAPYPFNQLPSQSRGAVKAVKTILKAGGYHVVKTINLAHSSHYEDRKKRIYRTIDSCCSRINP